MTSRQKRILVFPYNCYVIKLKIDVKRSEGDIRSLKMNFSQLNLNHCQTTKDLFFQSMLKNKIDSHHLRAIQGLQRQKVSNYNIFGRLITNANRYNIVIIAGDFKAQAENWKSYKKSARGIILFEDFALLKIQFQQKRAASILFGNAIQA